MVFLKSEIPILDIRKNSNIRILIKKKITFDIKKSWISDLENSNWEFDILISMNKH